MMIAEVRPESFIEWLWTMDLVELFGCTGLPQPHTRASGLYDGLARVGNSSRHPNDTLITSYARA